MHQRQQETGGEVVNITGYHAKRGQCEKITDKTATGVQAGRQARPMRRLATARSSGSSLDSVYYLPTCNLQEINIQNMARRTCVGPVVDDHAVARLQIILLADMQSISQTHTQT